MRDRLYGRLVTLVVVACGLVFFVGFARYALSAEFNFDDWEWLRRSRHPLELLRDQFAFEWEVFRPLPQHVYGFFQAVFGARPLPLALFFLGVHVAAAVLAAQCWMAMGLSVRAACFAAVIALFGYESTQTFQFLSFNQVILSRLFVLGALQSFLRVERPAFGRWFPWVLAGLCTHEQSILMAPLVVLCLVYRDGLRGVARMWRDPSLTAMLWLCTGYGALRFVVRDPSHAGTHALGTGALREKAVIFAQHYRDLGLRFFVLPTPRLNYLIAALIAVSALLFFRRRGLGALRLLLFGVAWTVLAYAPYFFAIHETAGYHFALALAGLAVPVAVFLDDNLAAPTIFALRLAWLPLCLPVLFPVVGPPRVDSRERSTAEVLARVAESVGPERDGVTRLVFVDDNYRVDGPPPRYLVGMSGEFDFNRLGDPAGNRNGALAVSYPDRNFRVWVLAADRLPYLCARAGDVVLRVDEQAHPDGVPSTYHFAPLPACASALPAAYAAPALTPPTGAPPEWPALEAAARRYWAAYARGNASEAVDAARKIANLVAAVAKASPAPQTAPATASALARMVEPIKATVPPLPRGVLFE